MNPADRSLHEPIAVEEGRRQAAWLPGHTGGESAGLQTIAIARGREETEAGQRGREVMRTLDSSEASMARINGILIRSAIVVAIAATIVLPLFR